MSRLQILWDALAWLVPFSLAGAIFGDAIRRDALGPRQRIAAGLFSWMMGPLVGGLVMREFGWSDNAALVVAATAPTLVYDVIGLVASILRAAKDDPRGWLAIVRDALPWGSREGGRK